MIYLAHNLLPTFPKIQLNHLPALYTEKYMQYYPFWSSYHKWLRYCVNEANIWDFLYAMFIHLLTNFCVKMRFICQFMYKWADTGKNVTLEKSEESFCGSVKQALWNNPPPSKKEDSCDFWKVTISPFMSAHSCTCMTWCINLIFQ